MDSVKIVPVIITKDKGGHRNMARRGENIYCRKNGRWEGKYVKCRVDGKIRYGYVSGKSYEETLRKKHEAIKAMQTGTHKSRKRGELLFAVVAEKWMETQKPILKETSIAKYEGILSHYLIPEFGDMLITEITREKAVECLQRLLAPKGEKESGLAPKTVTGIFSVLKTILDFAKIHGNVTVTDLRNMPVKQARRPLRVLSVKEQRTLEDYLSEEMDGSGFGIMLCLYTGIRLGELCALKWEDISFTEKTLYVHRTMERVPAEEGGRKKTKIIVTQPKSICSVRYIPLPDKVFHLAKERKGEQEAFILTGSPKKFIEPRTMENHFLAAIQKCGISKANFHALRHTFATRCVELGFDAKSLSEILGHASVRITMDRYVHPTMEAKQRNMDRLSELMSAGND